MRYFYHPESDALWEDENHPGSDVVDELDYDQYQKLKGKLTMPGMTGTFDANMVPPKQIGESHPVGKFPFMISHVVVSPTKEGDGGMWVVTFKTPAGEIPNRYNLWNKSDRAVQIANGQVSALCHATGVFKLQWENDGAAMINAQGMIEVGYQKGQEPTSENPAGGYTEIKKVLDRNGNEPGKAPQAGPQTNAGNGGWNNQPQQNQPQQQPAQQEKPPMTQQPGGWGNQAQPQQQQPAQQQPPWAKQG